MKSEVSAIAPHRAAPLSPAGRVKDSTHVQIYATCQRGHVAKSRDDAGLLCVRRTAVLRLERLQHGVHRYSLVLHVLLSPHLFTWDAC